MVKYTTQRCPNCDKEIEEDSEFGNNKICRYCGDLIIPKEVREVPNCFTYYDKKDRSCTKCPIQSECIEEQTETRPLCFGIMYDIDLEECKRCVDNSQCSEQEERENSMNRKVRVHKRGGGRRRRRVVEKEEVLDAQEAPEELVVEKEEEKVEIPNNKDYATWDVKPLRAEAERRGLPFEGKRTATLARALLRSDKIKDEREPEVESKSRQRRRKIQEPAVAEPTEIETEVSNGALPEDIGRDQTPARSLRKDVVEPATTQVSQNLVSQLLSTIIETMHEKGTTLIVVPREQGGYELWFSDRYTFSLPPTPTVKAVKAEVKTKTPVKKGLKGKAFDNEAFSDEYKEFMYEDCGTGKGWTSLSREEKEDFAKSERIEWDQEGSPTTQTISLSREVQSGLDIKKWKTQYASRSARKALKAGN